MLPDTAQRHHYAWLSIAAALLTITLKTVAWWITGSVGLLSDALESFVNLAGAGFALWMILVTRTPPDDGHPFGHGKAEYFSSGFEGGLIFVAALAIVGTGVQRLLHPEPLEALGWGMAFSGLSTLINFVVALTLARAGKRFNSIALTADSRHLMTDVWTSVGVVAGVLLVALTGQNWLDPVIAIAVGLHIMLEGWRLGQTSVDGLMDRSLEPEQLAELTTALDAVLPPEATYRNLKSRRAGTQSFVQVDILVPGDWSVTRGHDLLDAVEARLEATLPDLAVTTHLEPREASNHG
ncbi:cation efflux family protein [Oryzomicrobium terrae]|uniref:Cation efflux family protein n=1 Tax=Oryzomicrobium terrae TaxID=1735038 RepID=A0A5C1E9P8_9RHOO|nr:cation diffusion facilitator family transporter [Oryzomicrobium terrae]QEL64887.1 cation efflux family protein [Oryzomicrobium terrae]